MRQPTLATEVSATFDGGREMEVSMSEVQLNLAIVDDDPAIVRIVERLVDQHLPGQFAAISFCDPREARHWLSQHDCDVLISDVEMPGVGGLELLREGVRRNPDLQTIFLTAHSAWDRIAAAIELGASDYLLKPVDHAHLIGLLRQHHDRRIRQQPNAGEFDVSPVLAAG
jgi:two-component system response regulator YesN